LIREPNKNDWLTIIQFVFSVVAILGFWALALALLVFGIFSPGDFQGGKLEKLSLYVFAAGSAAVGLLVVPSAVYSFNRISGRDIAVRFPDRWWLHPTILILALPAVLLLGHLAARQGSFGLLLLPFFHILAVGLPVLWFLYLGVRGLPLGSQQRRWGVFDSGLVLGPIMIMLVEVILLGVVILVIGLFLINQPDLLRELFTDIEGLVNSNADPDHIITDLRPYLLNPAVIFLVYLFAALLVPLVEEALKPVGVWLLINRGISPAEGFTAGLMSGAGYAFFESLALTSAAEQWMMIVVARIGTAVIHILTAGLMGWVMVYSWRNSSYLRLGFTYLGVVCLHGLWNGLTLLMVLALIIEESNPVSEIYFGVPAIGGLVPFFLGMLSLTAFLALLWVNRYLKKVYREEGSPGGAL